MELTASATNRLYWSSMAETPFEAAHAVRFDINRGQVFSGPEWQRCLVPVGALQSLLEGSGPEGSRAFGAQLGGEAAVRIQSRLGSTESLSLRTVVDHIAGEIALFGLGSLTVERWGSALVFCHRECPLSRAGAVVLSAFVESLVQRLWSRDCRAVVLQESPESGLRLLVVGQATAGRVQGWQDERLGMGQILERLNQGQA